MNKSALRLSIVILLLWCSSFCILTAKNIEREISNLVCDSDKEIIKGCEAIILSSLEMEDINNMKILAQKYNISDLKDISHLRELGTLESSYEITNRIFCELLSKIQAKNKKISYSEVFVRLVQLFACPSHELIKENSSLAYNAAKELHTREKNIPSEELLLVSRLLNITHSTDTFGPTQYKEFKICLFRLLALYEDNHLHGLFRHELSSHLIEYLSYMKDYIGYCAYIDKELSETENKLYRDISIENIYNFQRNEVKFRFNKSHPEHLFQELFLCLGVSSNTRKNAETKLQKIDSLQQISLNYYGDCSHITKSIRFIRNCMSIQLGEQESSFNSEIEDDLTVIINSYNNNFRSIISALSTAFYSYINTDPMRSVKLYKMMDNLTTKFKDSDPILFFQVKSLQIVLQHAVIDEYYSSYEDIKSLLHTFGLKGQGWTYVKIARDLRFIVASIYGVSDATMELTKLIYDAEHKLVNENTPLGVICGVDYLFWYCNTPKLYYDDDLNVLFEQLECESEKYSIQQPLILLLHSNHLFKRNNLESAKSLIFKAKPKCNTKDELRLLYTFWLHQLASVNPDNSLTNESVDFIEELFKEEYDDLIEEHMDTYLTLAGFYLNNHNLEGAHRIAQRCFNYYSSESNTINNGFTSSAKILMNVYAKGYRDLEQCRLCIEKVGERLEEIKTFIGTESYINFLQMYYELVEYKNPADITLLAYLNMLQGTYQDYVRINGYSQNIQWSAVPFILSKISNIIRTWVQSSNNSNNDFYKQREIIKDQISNIVELGQNLYDDIQNNNPHLKSTQEFFYLQSGLCNIYEYLTEDYNKAEMIYKQMLETTFFPYKLNYLSYLCRQEKWADALTILEEYNTSFYREIERLENNDDKAELAYFYHELFPVYYKNNLYDEAKKIAFKYFDINKEIINTNFDYLTPEERESMIRYNGIGAWPTYTLLELQEDEIIKRAYDASLQEKGILLRSFEELRKLIFQSDNKELKNIFEEIHRLDMLLTTIKSNDQDGINEAKRIRKESDALKHKLANLTLNLRDTSKTNVTWGQIRESLNGDEVAIEFVPGATAIYALILTSNCNSPYCVKILDMDSFSFLSSFFNSESDITLKMKELYDKEAKHLYEIIWKPLLPYIGKRNKIYYSPAGILCSISFNALQLEDNSYLIDHYQLYELTTTTNVLKRHNNPENVANATIIGGLCYEDRHMRTYKRQVEMAKNFISDISLQRESMQSFNFLPFSYVEKDHITTTFVDAGISVTEKSLMDATEKDVRELLKISPDILHISTHGFSYTNFEIANSIPYFHNNAQSTVLSTAGIALSNANYVWEGGKLPKETDNILTADEIAALDLRNTKLAVLSACNTALGAISFDGVMGLQRGLKQAGVETICLSLWSVNDASSQEIMSNFYKNWLKGKRLPMEEAMRKAMLQQRELTPSPYFWAPFILIDNLEYQR